jgi:hypothetical protein
MIAHRGYSYSIFDSGLCGKLQAKWLLLKEETSLHAPKAATSESKMLSFIVAAAR